MRKIGTIADKAKAEAFADFLYSKGIGAEARRLNGEWAIWVHSDDQLDEARLILTSFMEDPDSDEHAAAIEAARIKRSEEEARQKKDRSKTIHMRKRWQRASSGMPGPLTLTLIIISVAVFLLTGMGENDAVLRYLYIADVEVRGGYYYLRPFLTDILNGQVWRLFTPMFIHLGFMHIIFNMLWLRDLGGMIESLEGPLRLGVKIAVIQVVSALFQYYFFDPVFGGMSGVVYGLFGYVWMRHKYDPFSGYMLHPSTVTMMLIWFFLCFTPIIPGIANGVHAAGLATGVAWGWLSSHRGSWQRH